MDQSERCEVIVTYQLLKKITKLVLSVYVFSLFLSYSSSFPFFLHSMNKNCIFLLCNGILVLLAKTSGFTRLSPPANLADQFLKRLADGSQIPPAVEEEEVSVEAPLCLQENIIIQEEGKEPSIEDEGDPEHSHLIPDDKEQEMGPGFFPFASEGGEENNEELDNTVSFEVVEDIAEAEEEEEDIGLLSTDELNKKFDEFIRRMKEEIRIGAEQQLVLVN